METGVEIHDPTGRAGIDAAILDSLVGGQEAGRSAEGHKQEGTASTPDEGKQAVEPGHHFTALGLEDVPLLDGMTWDYQAAEPILNDLRVAGVEGISSLAGIFMATGGVYEGSAEDAIAEVRGQFSPFDFDDKLNAAKQLVAGLSESTRKALDESGYGNHPSVVLAFMRAAERQAFPKAPSAPSAPPQPGAELTPAEAKAEYDRVLADNESPYWRGEHPNHEAAVKRMSALAARAFNW